MKPRSTPWIVGASFALLFTGVALAISPTAGLLVGGIMFGKLYLTRHNAVTRVERARIERRKIWGDF